MPIDSVAHTSQGIRRISVRPPFALSEFPDEHIWIPGLANKVEHNNTLKIRDTGGHFISSTNADGLAPFLVMEPASAHTPTEMYQSSALCAPPPL